MSSQRGLAAAVVVAVILAVGLLGAEPAEAGPLPAKRITYPVKLTPIKVKSTELPPDSKWWHFPGITAETPIIALYGRVTSPKPACRRGQPIIAVYQPPGAPGPGEDRSTGIVTDSTGSWEGEAVPDYTLESVRSGKERIWAKVARKRLGKGRFCAEAVSPRLKA